MCGDDSRVIAGLPIEAFQNAIQPNEAQRAALEELANASEKAAAGLKASCPTDVALTAPRRLAADAAAHRSDDRRGADGASAAR